MTERFVCEFCGEIYETKKKALICERKAKKLKPKFKVGDILYNVDRWGDYNEDEGRFKVLKVLRWQPNLDAILNRIFDAVAVENGRDAQAYDNFLHSHTFLYVLLALETENKEIDFTKRDIFHCARVKHNITRGTKGIALKFELDLRTKPSQDN